MSKKYDWRKGLTDHEAERLKRYDEQISMQTSAVETNPDNHDLIATLTLLKYRRYLLQSKVAARQRRRKLSVNPRVSSRASSLAAA